MRAWRSRHVTSHHCQWEVWASFDGIPVWGSARQGKEPQDGEMDEDVCKTSRRQLIFEGPFVLMPAHNLERRCQLLLV